MSNLTIIRKLYKVTKDHATVSVNEMREYGIHNEFRHGNQIGSFFTWMGKQGYTKTVGHTRVKHEKGNGRWIWNWRWTEKAHREFGPRDLLNPQKGQQRLF